MQKRLFAIIGEHYPALSKGQKKIADYICAHYEEAAYMTAGALGRTVSVSESTVVRFAVELGFSGYPALQSYMQEMVKSHLTAAQRMEVSGRRISRDQVVEQVLSGDMELIRGTIQQADTEAFDRVVDMVNGARRIYIIGVRSSSALAGFLAFYFRLIYDNVMLVDTAGGSEIFESLMRSTEDDVCIAVSFPRYSKQILNALSFVRERGTKVVAITDSGDTSLAALADEVLLAKSDMASFVDSLVAPLSLINALIVAAAHDRRAEMADQLAKLEEVWDRYQVYEKEDPHE